jgi:hypothetical protein
MGDSSLKNDSALALAPKYAQNASLIAVLTDSEKLAMALKNNQPHYPQTHQRGFQPA